jgi:hypothetical protein
MQERHICKCPICGVQHSPDIRVVTLYRGILQALFRVYQYVRRRGGGYLFTRKEINHLLAGNANHTARFGDLVMFGGLVFKPEKGSRAHYGLNMERCEAFFKGSYEIPMKVLKDPVTGAIEATEYKTIKDIPNILTLLDEEGFYKPEYRSAARKTV